MVGYLSKLKAIFEYVSVFLSIVTTLICEGPTGGVQHDTVAPPAPGPDPVRLRQLARKVYLNLFKL